jgi:hypothetical protein
LLEVSNAQQYYKGVQQNYWVNAGCYYFGLNTYPLAPCFYLTVCLRTKKVRPDEASAKNRYSRLALSCNQVIRREVKCIYESIPV